MHFINNIGLDYHYFQLAFHNTKVVKLMYIFLYSILTDKRNQTLTLGGKNP